MGHLILMVIMLAAAVFAAAMNLARYRALRLSGRKSPTLLKVSNLALSVAVIGGVLAVLAEVFGW